MFVESVAWGPLIGFALFFGGLGGGSFIVAVITSILTGERFENIQKWGAYIGVVSAMLTIIFFALDAGSPERFYFLYSNPSSMIWVGTSTLTLIIPFGIVYTATYSPLIDFVNILPMVNKLVSPLMKLKRAIEIIVFLLGVALVSYTSFVLGVIWSKPFWNTPLITILFFLSGVSTAMMAISLVLSFIYARGLPEKPFKMLVEALHRLDVADAYFLAFEIITILTYIQTMYFSDPVSKLASTLILQGQLSWLFWGIVLVLGMIFPIIVCVILAWKGRTKAFIKIYPVMMIPASICALIGGLTMRYIILVAPQIAALL